LEDAPKATGNAPSGARPDPEVVATARRRQFTSVDKRRILDAADRCTQPGEIGALLRKEGIYSSHLTTWRSSVLPMNAPRWRRRSAGARRSRTGRGSPCAPTHQENDRLRRKLAQANAIIDVQKKLCTLLGLTTDDTPSESC